jgi:hypothetical protein
MKQIPAEEMSSTGFVAYAIELARSAKSAQTAKSWDAAEYAFAGPPRWESPERDESAVLTPDDQAGCAEQDS